MPGALVPPGGIDFVLDEFFGGAIAHAPRNTVVVASAAAIEGGGLAIAIQDAGVDGPKRSAGALERQAFALARELVERWGGKLDAGVAARGKGRVATLILAATHPSEEQRPRVLRQK